jgi:hypothetical protein
VQRATAMSKTDLLSIHFKSSQVKLLITSNAFNIVQRAAAMSNTENNRVYGAVEAPQVFFSTTPTGAN